MDKAKRWEMACGIIREAFENYELSQNFPCFPVKKTRDEFMEFSGAIGVLLDRIDRLESSIEKHRDIFSFRRKVPPEDRELWAALEE